MGGLSLTPIEIITLNINKCVGNKSILNRNCLIEKVNIWSSHLLRIKR